MFKRKEEIVRDQPARSVEPEVIERTTYVEDKQPRFVLGFLFGALLLAGAVILFANQQGSYRRAGASMDKAMSTASGQIEDAGAAASRQLDQAGERTRAD